MKPKELAVVMLAFVALAMLLAIGLLGAPRTPQPALATSSVLLTYESGLGSGVHIGNGYILTAAHVADDRPEITVKDSRDNEQPAEVLWVNKTYDLALLRIKHFDRIHTAALDCGSPPAVGAPITAVGNPLGRRGFSAWGHIGSRPTTHGPWKIAMMADLTVAPGMSGGPVFDAAGKVVAVVVGAFAPAGNLLAISLVVPSNVACSLMGRTA